MVAGINRLLRKTTKFEAKSYSTDACDVYKEKENYFQFIK